MTHCKRILHVIKLDDKFFTGLIMLTALAKTFCDTNADMICLW